ncbi:FAD/NAD(P)-binding protein [Candidatus Saganbacteria bacterium]|uniref:FAD/NAD(P)-binding protein n=1 Tax=Candidatus Saganbacteria bacterium TaxID=2575572 RepID=A0A9D6UMM8_UNCSA|nr:FAD/NAD(P)-binding protein [Candidatus Saganbacteria bacterium]
MRNLYLPKIAVIDEVSQETPDVKLFTIKYKELKDDLGYKAGQFFMVSVFGFGEAPISVTSTPTCGGYVELAVKCTGSLTSELHKMKRGEEIGLRGPYGNGFPVDSLKGFDLLFVGGGIGLAPLRSLINLAIEKNNHFGKITILYGARTYDDMVFKSELSKEWREKAEVLTTVDMGENLCDGNVGLVTALLPKIKVDVRKTKAIVCGPPVMIPFVLKDLTALGFDDTHIISTLERHMKCGVCKCNHCNIGSKYVCLDGPVFTYAEMKLMTREF